jgi:hypothetical protein
MVGRAELRNKSTTIKKRPNKLRSRCRGGIRHKHPPLHQGKKLPGFCRLQSKATNINTPSSRIWNIYNKSQRQSITFDQHTANMAMTGAKKLRELMSQKDHIIVAPGVYDGLSARIALAAGAECLYMVCFPPLPSIHHPKLPHQPLNAPSPLTTHLKRQEQEPTCPASAPQTSASQP